MCGWVGGACVRVEGGEWSGGAAQYTNTQTRFTFRFDFCARSFGLFSYVEHTSTNTIAQTEGGRRGSAESQS